MRAATTAVYKTEKQRGMRNARVRCASRCARRRGVVLTSELLFVLPILVLFLFAMIEFGMLWSANHRIKMASQVACRIATLPASDPEQLRQELRAATSRVMQHQHLIQRHRISLESGTYAGDPVIVEVRLPMEAAAPDLLRIFGFEIAGRELVARTVMRKE